MTRPRSRMVGIGQVVPQVLRDLGFEKAQLLSQLSEAWPSVVGEEAATHARPDLLRKGELEVMVDSSAWANEIQMRRVEILDGLREALGADAPTSLRLRVGRSDLG